MAVHRVSSPRIDRLVATAAHQLRGPLSVITGMTSVLRVAEVGKTRDGLDTIAAESARLARMIDNLCAIPRCTPEALRREWVPIEDLLGAALGRLDAELGARPIELGLVANTLVHADPLLLELVLVNLIENAARYSPAGSRIDIAARREAIVAVIEISDRGPGLPPELADREGRGLGLAVSRGIADAHGGAVVSWAREGGGAVVLVTIPDAAPLPEGVPAGGAG